MSAKPMSLRRAIGDHVLACDGEDELPYTVKIVSSALGRDFDDCMYDCGDPDCKEWAIVEVLNENGVPTGERVYHLTECHMFDAEKQS